MTIPDDKQARASAVGDYSASRTRFRCTGPEFMVWICKQSIRPQPVEVQPKLQRLARNDPLTE